MNYFRPNVRVDPPQEDWFDSREQTIAALNLRPSTHTDSPLKCETPPEFCMFVGLWSALREVQDVPGNLHIQHQIGRCRLDLALIGNGKKINIEVDGESFHRTRADQDRKRDQWLSSQGWTVMRYSARDLMIDRHYACWAGGDVCDFYLGKRTLDELRSGGWAFEAELAEHYPRLVVPVDICMSCQGSGRYGDEGLDDCEACDGSGKEVPGTRSKIDWVKIGWDWEEEWAACGGRAFASILD